MIRARGPSLIELVLTLGISGLVLAAMLGLLVHTVQSQRVTFAEAALQREGDYAALLLEQDIRAAGVTVRQAGPAPVSLTKEGLVLDGLELPGWPSAKVRWQREGSALVRQVCPKGRCRPAQVIARNVIAFSPEVARRVGRGAPVVSARLRLAREVVGRGTAVEVPAGASVGGWR